MKTFHISLISLIVASCSALLVHAIPIASDTHLTAYEGMNCQQSGEVKVCPSCNGSGKFGNNTCLGCGGKGIVRQNGQKL